MSPEFVIAFLECASSLALFPGEACLDAEGDAANGLSDARLSDKRSLRNIHTPPTRLSEDASPYLSTFGQATRGRATRPELAVGCTRRGAAYADRGTGTIVDSKGNRDESGTFRKDSSWCAYYGEQAGAVEGLALMQHPQNSLRGRWFTRNYGFMSPTPFAHDGAVEMSAGTTFKFAYRVVVFEGDHEEADIKGWYKDFANESN